MLILNVFIYAFTYYFVFPNIYTTWYPIAGGGKAQDYPLDSYITRHQNVQNSQDKKQISPFVV